MTNLISRRHFVCTDLEKNSNKFWIGELYDNPPKVVMRFGRVGSDEQTKDRSFTSILEAQKFFEDKIKDKSRVKSRRDSYTEIQVIEESAGKPVNVGNRDVEAIALSEIQTSSPSVKDLIKWLCRVNKHNILTNTTIKYDINEGTFKTPLGVVDKNCLEQARLLLDSISVYVQSGDYSNKELVKLVNSYLRYIPQDLGGSNVKINLRNIFPDSGALDKQSGLIDSLSASISSAKVIDGPKTRVFDTVVEEVDKSSVSKYKPGNNRINKVYSIAIKSVNDAYNNYGKKKGNVVNAWHGTDAGNALSILRHGLIIPSNYAHGRVYGHGIYMDRSIDHPLHHYSSRVDGKRLVFVTEAALGNYKTTGKASLQDDALWVGGNSYIIVPRTNQVSLLYLVEFI